MQTNTEMEARLVLIGDLINTKVNIHIVKMFAVATIIRTLIFLLSCLFSYLLEIEIYKPTIRDNVIFDIIHKTIYS